MAITFTKQLAFVAFLFVALTIGYVVYMKYGSMSSAEIDIITEHRTRAILSILTDISTLETGVRRYDLKNNFAYELNQTHIRLTYMGQELATSTDKHTFLLAHHIENILPSENLGGTDRICVSKLIVACVPLITICDEGEPCCTMTENKCKYIT